jgi:hypothetical protein
MTSSPSPAAGPTTASTDSGWSVPVLVDPVPERALVDTQIAGNLGDRP